MSEQPVYWPSPLAECYRWFLWREEMLKAIARQFRIPANVAGEPDSDNYSSARSTSRLLEAEPVRPKHYWLVPQPEADQPITCEAEP